MMKIRRSQQFKRDFKKYKKKHYNMEKLLPILDFLVKKDSDTLRRIYKDHSLIGNWEGYRELHIEKDWLLIYSYEEDYLVLALIRMGSHDELFE